MVGVLIAFVIVYFWYYLDIFMMYDEFILFCYWFFKFVVGYSFKKMKEYKKYK